MLHYFRLASRYWRTRPDHPEYEYIVKGKYDLANLAGGFHMSTGLSAFHNYDVCTLSDKGKFLRMFLVPPGVRNEIVSHTTGVVRSLAKDLFTGCYLQSTPSSQPEKLTSKGAKTPRLRVPPRLLRRSSETVISRPLLHRLIASRLLMLSRLVSRN